MIAARSFAVLVGVMAAWVGVGNRSPNPDLVHRKSLSLSLSARPLSAADSQHAVPRFLLAATPRAQPASGWVELVPAASPFGLAVSRDGRIVYDLDITVTDLPVPSSLGPYTLYEAWLTTPKLDLIKDLGAIRSGVPLHAQVDWNKFTVIVSAESAPVRARWSEAVALVGRSPSATMQSFAGHPFYKTGEAPF